MAANKYQGEVEIYLGRMFTLKLDFRACGFFEQQTGISVDEFFLEGSGNVPGDPVRKERPSLKVSNIVALLWACLMRTEKIPPTIDQVYELFEAAEGKNEVEKKVYVLNKFLELWCARQGLDMEKLNQKAQEIVSASGNDGEQNRPPVETSASRTT